MTRLALLLLLAISAMVAQGQDLFDQLPECTLNCTTQFLAQLSCSSTDKSCLCTNPEGLMNGVVECASVDGCSGREVLFSTNSTLAYCDVPPRDNSLVLQVITGVFGGLALLAVFLRMVTRFHPFKAAFGWDDGLILSVAVVGTVVGVGQIMNTVHGFGRDLFTIYPDDIEFVIKWFYTNESNYVYCVAVTKISILAFYLRIFTDQTFKKTAYVMMGVCTAYVVAFILVTVFQCTPVSYTWTSWSGETEGTCINVFVMAWLAATTNVVLDILVILLPIPHLLKLTMSRKKKLQIVAMFCVGLFVTLVSVVRLSSLVLFKETKNFSWDHVGVSYMSMLEIDVGTICACMPALQLLMRRIAPGMFGSTVDESSYLHPHTASRSRTRTFRHTNSHTLQSKGITKTITTTVADVQKDSDSVIELVDNERQLNQAAHLDGSSFATVSTEAPHKSHW